MGKRQLAIGLFCCLLMAQCRHGKNRTTASPVQSASLTTYTWESVGPYAAAAPLPGTSVALQAGCGIFYCVDIRPGHLEEILAGHASCGLFKSTDGGQHWEQKLKFPFATGISSIFRFRNSRHLLASSMMCSFDSVRYGYGLIESFDGGETWSRNTLQFEPLAERQEYISVIQAVDRKEKKLLAISARTVFYSGDGGKTWRVVLESDFNMKGVSIDPSDEKSILIGGNGMLQSSDGGLSWRNIRADFPEDTAKEPLYTYTPAFSNMHAQRAYLVICDKTARLAQWHPREGFTLLNIPPFPSGTEDPLLLIYDHKNPVSESLLVFTDNFYTYTDKHKSLQHLQDIRGLNFLSLQHKTLYAAGSSGIYKSSDEGLSWTSLVQTASDLNSQCIYGFDRSSNGDMMCGAAGSGVLSYRNKVWYTCKTGADAGRISALKDSQTFACSFGHMTYFTKNAGFNFDYNHAGTEHAGNNYRMLTHKKTGDFYLANTHLYKKRNNKYYEILSSSLEPDARISALWVNPANDQEIWICKDGSTGKGELKNKLFYTKDGGINWLDYTYRMPSISNFSVKDIYVSRKGQVAIAVNGFDQYNKVFISNDNGFSFSSQSAGLPNVPVACLLSIKEQWFCGTADGLLTLKQGRWERFGNELPIVPVSEMKYFESDNFLYVSTFGRGIWRVKVEAGSGK
jgi:photosystem II stability/assembly factor-like uncharacterized protein